MRKLVAAAITAGALFVVGSQAGAAPADQGNCISDQDNGGAAGTRYIFGRRARVRAGRRRCPWRGRDRYAG